MEIEKINVLGELINDRFIVEVLIHWTTLLPTSSECLFELDYYFRKILIGKIRLRI